MDVSRALFESRCRFYRGDDRPTRIRWYFALPGATYYTGPSAFATDRDWEETAPIDDDRCGELPGRRRYGNWPTPPWLTGQHHEGDEDDFAGRKSLPELLGTDCGTPAALELAVAELVQAEPSPLLLSCAEYAIPEPGASLALRLVAFELSASRDVAFPELLLTAVEYLLGVGGVLLDGTAGVVGTSIGGVGPGGVLAGGAAGVIGTAIGGVGPGGVRLDGTAGLDRTEVGGVGPGGVQLDGTAGVVGTAIAGVGPGGVEADGTAGLHRTEVGGAGPGGVLAGGVAGLGGFARPAPAGVGPGGVKADGAAVLLRPAPGGIGPGGIMADGTAALLRPGPAGIGPGGVMADGTAVLVYTSAVPGVDCDHALAISLGTAYTFTIAAAAHHWFVLTGLASSQYKVTVTADSGGATSFTLKTGACGGVQMVRGSGSGVTCFNTFASISGTMYLDVTRSSGSSTYTFTVEAGTCGGGGGGLLPER